MPVEGSYNSCFVGFCRVVHPRSPLDILISGYIRVGVCIITPLQFQATAAVGSLDDNIADSSIRDVLRGDDMLAAILSKTACHDSVHWFWCTISVLHLTCLRTR
jgi:hypothetical protein